MSGNLRGPRLIYSEECGAQAPRIPLRATLQTFITGSYGMRTDCGAPVADRNRRVPEVV